MLETPAQCERCAAALAHDAEAFIGSFGCPFCAAGTSPLSAVGPYRAGELVLGRRRSTD